MEVQDSGAGIRPEVLPRVFDALEQGELPNATGYELMEQMRDRHGIRGIVLSGYGMEDDVRKSRRRGSSSMS